MVIDYKLGKIYKIVNDLNDEIYIGSTVNTLSKRMANHRANSVKYPNIKLYKFVKDNGGWDHFKIILIEDYPCERKEQLLQREQYYKKIATLNNNNCYGFDWEREKRRHKKYRESNKDKLKVIMKEYYESNKDKIKDKKKEYYESNKDKLKDKMKEYYESNKDKIKDKKKEYYESNKDKIKDKMKEYYESNKDKIKGKSNN